MGEHSSYHNSIPGQEAERRLKLFSRHCYLTRYSELSNCYVLSVYQKEKPKDIIKHFKITLKDGRKHKIDGKSMEFESISELLNHYEQNRIDFALKSIGDNCTKEKHDLAEEAREKGGEAMVKRQSQETQQQENPRSGLSQSASLQHPVRDEPLHEQDPPLQQNQEDEQPPQPQPQPDPQGEGNEQPQQNGRRRRGCIVS